MSGRRAILFDLDGTLLPMDREEFVRAYLPGVSAVAAHLGDPRKIADSILKGSYAMVKARDPQRTLEAVFWEAFEALCGISRASSEHVFDAFYRSAAFDKLREMMPAEPLVPGIVAEARRKGYRAVLATSPLFPRIATEKRIEWAGLKLEDFELISTYEDFHAAKPNREYYEEVLEKTGLKAGECIMVGNDAREDLPAPKELGMETFLVLNHAIIPEGMKYECDHQGTYGDLMEFIKGL